MKSMITGGARLRFYALTSSPDEEIEWKEKQVEYPFCQMDDITVENDYPFQSRPDADKRRYNPE